jgi:hypothetical protein
MSPSKVTKPADGHAGARRCAALLGMAVCAETTSATLQEEARKVDLKLSFRDPFTNASHNLNCQVKSGVSFKAASSTKKTIKLKGISKETIEAFKNSLGLITWVPPRPWSAIYWFICRPGTKAKHISMSTDTQKISPALRFILAREFAQRQKRPAIARQTVAGPMASKALLKTSRSIYRGIKTVPNPLFGAIAITRSAWRHITRRSKTTASRDRSLRVLPHLRAIIGNQPDSHSVKEASIRDEGRSSIERRVIVCWYGDALVLDGKHTTVMLRICEEISYPKAWHKFPLSESDVFYKSTLLSWWAK